MWTDCDTSEAGDAIVLMRAVKDVMYALVNSNAMNAEVIGYNPPIWQEYLHWINIGAFTPRGCLAGAGDCAHGALQQAAEGENRGGKRGEVS